MKKMILLLGLILGICNMGVTAFAEESLVEVQIHTRSEDGTALEGTESIALEIYDLTDWRIQRASDEKTDKAFILNTYPTKAELAAFVKQAQLPKYSQAPLLTDNAGKVTVELPRYQREQDAAYLILASGEKGKYQMLPMIIYLPQYQPSTEVEATSLLYSSKYSEIKPTKPTEPPLVEPSEPQKSWSETEQPKNYPEKRLPSTNELIRNYCFLGLLLMVVGGIGLRKQGGKK